MIRINVLVPRVGAERVRRVLLIIPKTLPSGSAESTTTEFRWLGFSYVRQRYSHVLLEYGVLLTTVHYRTGYKNMWVDVCFEDAPSQEVHISTTAACADREKCHD